MALDIIIINYNSGYYLKDCLASIYPVSEYRIIVFDNGSTDKSIGYAKKYFPFVEYIIHQANCGFARAINKVLEMTNNKYLLLLNPDVIVLPQTIALMKQFMKTRPWCGVLGGEILSPQGEFQPTCRRFPNYLNIIFGRRSLMRRFLPQNPLSSQYLYLDLDYAKPQKVDFLEGSLMMLRREALNDIGQLDEDFFLYLEDADLCYRLKKKGWETWWLPHAYAIHFRGENLRKDNIHPMLYHSLGFYKFFIKHYRPVLVIKCLLKLLLVLRLSYIIATESMKEYIR